ncbi:MAG: NAD(+) synthase [Haloferacaceae archaeon]
MCAPRRNVAGRPGDGGLATAPDALADLETTVHGFLAAAVDDADAERVVVGLDGSLGAAVTATLAADAVGPERVTGLVMPARLRHAVAAREAEAVAEALGIDSARVHLQPLLAAFQSAMSASAGPTDDPIATENALVRLRAACAYYVANATNGVVVGTCNRTDRLLGTVTKHGDTGVDFLPLGDCYRTEVRALADALEVPVDAGPETRVPGPRAGETDRGDPELSDEELDRLLHLLVDERLAVDVVAADVGVAPDVVERVAGWCVATRHKRRRPPTPTTYTG